MILNVVLLSSEKVVSKKEKKIRKIVQNPKNVTFEILDSILLEFGYEQRSPKGGSSHYTYSKEGEEHIITVPKKKPVKEFYVKRVISLLNLEEYIK